MIRVFLAAILVVTLSLLSGCDATITTMAPPQLQSVIPEATNFCDGFPSSNVKKGVAASAIEYGDGSGTIVKQGGCTAGNLELGTVTPDYQTSYGPQLYDNGYRSGDGYYYDQPQANTRADDYEYYQRHKSRDAYGKECIFKHPDLDGPGLKCY